MDTKSFEVLIHSQYAFDACRQEVVDYEDCKQIDGGRPRHPKVCRGQSKSLIDCYKNSEKMEPLCLDPFNDARECLFKSDGQLLSCRPFLQQYVECQKDPQEYKEYLAASTPEQKKPVSFDFQHFRTRFDKWN